MFELVKKTEETTNKKNLSSLELGPLVMFFDR